VGLDLRGDPLQRALDPDAAVEVVGHRGHEQDDDEGGEGPLEDEAEEGQGEDVEAEVGPELRVGLPAEGNAVAKEDPGVPLRGEAAGGHDGQKRGDAEAHPAGVGADELAVPLDQLLFRPGGAEAGLEAVGDDQVAEDEEEEDDGEDGRGERLGQQQPPPHVGVTELLEPQVVGVEPGDPPQAHQQHAEHGGQHDEGDPPVGRTAAPLDGRHTHEAPA
jgi:hypothetical protein